MRRMTFAAGALALVLLFFQMAPSFSRADECLQAKRSALTFIQDAPAPSDSFERFAFLYGRRVFAWWKDGGRKSFCGKWVIRLTEDVSEDGAHGFVIFVNPEHHRAKPFFAFRIEYRKITDPAATVTAAINATNAAMLHHQKGGTE